MNHLGATTSAKDRRGIIEKMVAPQRSRSIWIRYGLAVPLPLLGFLLNWLAFDLQRAPYFALFMATVAITALFGGRGPGLTNTVISTILAFLVAPPAWTLRLSEREDAIRIALFFVLGCLISVIIGVVGELERNLSREQSTLATILHTIGDAVITTDQDGQITFLNDVAQAATGWTLERALGKPVDEVARVISGEARVIVPHPVRLALKSRKPVDRVIDCLLARPDGTEIPITYSAACTDPRADRVPGGVFVLRDISKLKDAHNALLRSEKLAIAVKLAGTLAHEVNNPLEAATNLLFLSRAAPDLETARSFADEAFNETLRAAHFVHQTLAFAKPSERRQHVDVARLIDRALLLHSNKSTAKNVRVLKVCRPGISVCANPSELEQVIFNLVSNALDAIGNGGSLHVRTSRSNGKINILIGDTGCGITRQHLPRLFEAFFTTKPNVGVGLGLWVTKQVVDAHGGRIRLRSSQGRGTVVKVSFPAVDPCSGKERRSSGVKVQDLLALGFAKIPVQTADRG